jgi:hypothetical protein
LQKIPVEHSSIRRPLEVLELQHKIARSRHTLFGVDMALHAVADLAVVVKAAEDGMVDTIPPVTALDALEI